MYIGLSALLPISALVALVAAAPNAPETRDVGECNTGMLECCNKLYDKSDPALLGILFGLGLPIPDAKGMLGLDCSPLTAIGTGGTAGCSAKSVCCSGNEYGGLINVGCSPITL